MKFVKQFTFTFILTGIAALGIALTGCSSDSDNDQPATTNQAANAQNNSGNSNDDGGDDGMNDDGAAAMPAPDPAPMSMATLAFSFSGADCLPGESVSVSVDGTNIRTQTLSADPTVGFNISYPTTAGDHTVTVTTTSGEP